MLNLPQIAEVFKELPDYSDYNCSKTNNYSLQTAKRHSSLDGICFNSGISAWSGLFSALLWVDASFRYSKVQQYNEEGTSRRSGKQTAIHTP